MVYKESVTHDLIVYLSQCPEYWHTTNKYGKLNEPNYVKIAETIGINSETVKYHLEPEFAKEENKKTIRRLNEERLLYKNHPEKFVIKKLKRYEIRNDSESICNDNSLNTIFNDDETSRRLCGNEITSTYQLNHKIYYGK